MKTKLRFVPTLLILALGLSACSPKKVPRVTHLSPQDTTPVFELTGEEASNQFDELNVEEIRKLNNSSASSDSLIEKVIKPLKSIVLNPALIQDRSVAYSAKFLKLIEEFNRAIIELYQKDSKILDDQDILNAYKTALSISCDMNLKGGCPTIDIFGKTSNASKVVQLIAKRESDIYQHYRFLNIALELRNRSMDQEIAFLYLRRANELAQKQYSDTTSSSTQVPREMVADVARRFHNILVNFQPKDPKSPEFKTFIEEFNPWNYSRKGSDIFGSSATLMLGLAAENFLYAENGQLNKQLIEAIQQQQLSEDEKMGIGIVELMKRINQAPENRAIMSNFDLNYTFPANEYFYIVDRLFYDHLSVDDASSLWLKTKMESDKLVDIMQKYVRIQVANMIVYTNNNMKAFFNDSEKYGGRTFELLKFAVNKSLTLYSAWDNALDRVEKLHKLTNRHLKKYDTYARNSQSDTKLLALEEQFNSLRRNIKYLAVYPNMMMLVYLMARENFTDQIRTFWGQTYDVVAAQVIQAFFDGKMDPWFSFGNDSTRLRRTEVLYAFYFTLMTETFTTFATNKAIPVNEAMFFDEIIDKYFSDERVELENKIRELRTFVETNSNMFSKTGQICTYEKTLENGEAPSVPPILSISFNDFNNFTAMGTSSQSGTVVYFLDKFYSSAASPEFLRTLRTTFESKILFIRNMAKMLEKYFILQGKGPKDITARTEEKINELNNLKRDWIKMVFEGREQINGCYQYVLEREYDIQNQLYTLEAKHLGDVFDKIINLRSNKNVDAQNLNANIEFLQKYQINELFYPKEYIEKGGYDSILPEGYRYTKMDLFARLRAYLNQVAPNVLVSSTSFSELKYYQTPDPVMIEVNWSAPGAKEQFIQRGMAQMAAYVDWIGASTDIRFVSKMLQLQAELYRLGEFKIDSTASCDGQDDKTSKLCFKVSADDVVGAALDLSDLISLDQDDLKVLNLIGQSEKFPIENVLDQLYLEPSTRRPWPILETAFHYVVSDGDVGSKENSFMLDEIREYYETHVSLGHFFFQPSEDVQSNLIGQYKTHIGKYMTQVQEFLKSVEKAEQNKLIDGTLLTLTRDLAIKIGSSNGHPVYLSLSKKAKYNSLISSFHDDTAGLFSPSNAEIPDTAPAGQE